MRSFCRYGEGKLLDFDLGASFLEFGSDLLGLVLGDSFLEGLGSAVDHFLGFLQAQAGQGTDDLDDSDLVGASGLQDDVELGLLFLSSGSTGSRKLAADSKATPEQSAASARITSTFPLPRS